MNLPTGLDNESKRQMWWLQLAEQWKQAFLITILGHQNSPTDDELQKIVSLNTLRFAGPTAPYPNMPFELTNLSGIADLTNLEILVITHHKIQSIKESKNLVRLKCLFVYDNDIKDLEGIENLTNLEQFYCQNNQITHLKTIQKLTNLKDLYISHNEFTSLEGITKHHVKALKTFVCLPNEKLPYKEVIRMEQKLGIKCK
jgi:Leucine-rich repeat (LRR) protein